MREKTFYTDRYTKIYNVITVYDTRLTKLVQEQHIVLKMLFLEFAR